MTLRLVKSSNFENGSKNTKNSSPKCRMSPAVSHDWPSVARKAARLAALHPTAAEVIEKLVDDMLLDIERGQL